MADTITMDLVDSIASFSTARSMAEVQSAVAVKVLKMAQGQGQVAADLVASAVEGAQQSIEALAEGMQSQIDTYA
jgi:hypothetical protein